MSRDSARAQFEKALVETLLPIQSVKSEDQRAVVAQVASFVRGQLEALPAGLRLLLRSGLWGFRLVTRLRYLASFTVLPLPTRRRWVEQWAYGSVGLGRQLFRAIRSNTLVAYYELPEVRSRVVAEGNDAGNESAGRT